MLGCSAQSRIDPKLWQRPVSTEWWRREESVWIPCPQSPDKPCWHNVIHMLPRSSLPKIHAAQLDFAYSAESRDTMTPPAVPARGCTRPLTVNTFPTYRFLLRSEARLTELAATG